jgi:transcriptional regulator with XRE-family HTH domain
MNNPEKPLFEQATPSEFARKIRNLRRERGWTLSDVEVHSAGTITAVSMGAYERQTRSLSLEKAIDIAQLYGLPLAAIVESKPLGGDTQGQERRWVIDLRALEKIAIANRDEMWMAVHSFTREIIKCRHDWNGEIISLRGQDLTLISLIANQDYASVQEWLFENVTFHTRRSV